MFDTGFNLIIWGTVALLLSIANVIFNKERKQWGFSAKLLFYSPIVFSSVAIVIGLTYVFSS